MASIRCRSASSLRASTQAISVLSGTEGVAFCYFDDKDVVRHRLVQSIIRAYERWGQEKVASR